MWAIYSGIGILVAGVTGLALMRTVQHLILKRVRRGESFATFFKYFIGEEISEQLCLTIYQYLQKWAISDFPVRPTDRLLEIYGIAMDDPEIAEEVLKDLCPKLAIKTPSVKELSLIMPRPREVSKVEDFVRLVDRLKKGIR